ncbi:hypothetical protein B0H13DRAFT_1611404 [Mycena leptocephala]|nr:hypothetical protein B0H13DRAFT_1611404 [Mycena leptocephala]
MESPFAQHTDYAPFDSEVKWVKSHLIPHEFEVSRLDSLRDLSAQRGRTLQYIHFHKSLLSPVHRLPPDVLQEIFPASLLKHRNPVTSTKAPLILGRICSAWRTLTLLTPVLWASLHLPLQYIIDYSVHHAL